MPLTPFFPAWRSRLAPSGSRTAKAMAGLRAYTLSQLETQFGSCLPASLFPKAEHQLNSRDRIYTRWRTFWGCLWQSLNPLASGREVVRQLQALLQLSGGPSISAQDGAYCRARGRLPLSEFPRALHASAQAADRAATALTLLQGRPVKVIDGSTLTAPDTSENRSFYPPVQTPEPNFPMVRIVVMFSLLSGSILCMAQGSLLRSELSLLSLLLSQLAKGDIVIGDRGFGNFPVVALLQSLGVDFLGRSIRKADGRRRLKRLGKNDWLVAWSKGSKPSPWLELPRWTALAAQLTVRVVKGRCWRKGFRVRQVTLVTTLLDSHAYPAPQLLEAYLRRWRLEMCLDDLKTTLCMELLRSRSPAMLQKEIYARLIAHNLVRWTMAQAANTHGVELERISFKGTLDAVRHFTHAMARARSKKQRQALWAELLRTLAADLVPERPGRREPRAVKRHKNKYPRLSAPRHRFRDRPKRSVRHTRSRQRAALM
jgi:hypothetical protein